MRFFLWVRSLNYKKVFRKQNEGTSALLVQKERYTCWFHLYIVLIFFIRNRFPSVSLVQSSRGLHWPISVFLPHLPKEPNRSCRLAGRPFFRTVRWQSFQWHNRPCGWIECWNFKSPNLPFHRMVNGVKGSETNLYVCVLSLATHFYTNPFRLCAHRRIFLE